MVPYLALETGKPTALIDIGHEKTSICIVQDGILRMFRSINIGGRFITEFLAREFSLSFTDAEKLKHKVSQVISPAKSEKSSLKEEEKAVAERITQACDSIFREIGRTLYSFKDWGQAPVDSIILSGGTSLIEGLDNYLSESLKIEVKPTKLVGSEFSFKETYMKRSLFSSKVLLLLCELLPIQKPARKINMRKGEFAYVHDYGPIFEFANKIMRYASILLLVLTVSYLAKYIVYTQQNDQIIAAYKKEYLGTFPKAGAKFNYIGGDLSKVHDPVRNRLRREIMNSKKAIRNFTRLNRKSPALLALLRLSEDLPKSLKISILSFTYTQNNKMRFRVEAETYTALENFKKMNSQNLIVFQR